MTILVTAAGGQFGHLVIDALLRRGVAPEEIVAGARTVSKADDLAAQGVRVVPFDYDTPESLAAALDGVHTLLLVSGSEPGARLAGHRNVIAAAKESGVGGLVYTSLAQADTSTLVLAPDHAATEEAIAESRIPSTILRNNWYIENYLPDVSRAAQTGVIASSVGDARVAAAARADYAEAAAVVMTEEGHEGRVYELTGDTAFTYAELAAAASQVVGRDIAYVSLDREAFEKAMTDAGLDAGTAGFVGELEAGIARGDLAQVDPTLARLLGRPTTGLVEALRAALPTRA